MIKIKSPKDFWAGLMFLGFGLFFVIGAGHYRLGSAARMGPGYFPVIPACFLGLASQISELALQLRLMFIRILLTLLEAADFVLVVRGDRRRRVFPVAGGQGPEG